MVKLIDRIDAELRVGGIHFEYKNGKIIIPLPNSFDALVVEIWREEEDSITLMNGDFHTHGDILAREYDLESSEKAIRFLVESIFNGKFKMVKLYSDNGSFENTIWDSYALLDIDEYDNYEIVSEKQ
ncbi:MAG: hypothetical protein OEZ58_16785 [Gammaproteobacteria bacterium]|nr:hypothetical protein [Gammaproteobacteria bacterium]